MTPNGSTALEHEWPQLNSSKKNVLSARLDVDTFVFLAFSVLLAFVIILGNAMVMAAFKYSSKLRRRNNSLLTSLACSDCLVGVVSLPLWICISGLAFSTSNELYMFFISFDIFSALTSVFHLKVISSERYISVSRPFLYQRLPSNLYSTAIGIAWFSAAVIASLHPLQVMFHLQRYYAPVLSVLGFVGPLAAISCMYAGIFRIARTLSRHTPGISASTMRSRKNRLRQEIKTAMTLTIVTCLFFVAWLPFYVVLMSAVFCLPCLPSYPGLRRLIDFVKWMHYSNSAINPFVYALRDPEMKREFVRLCCNILLRRRLSFRKDQSTRVRL